jgi:hypothetical protein
MASVRALAERVRRLEQERLSPWARLIGTPEQFASDCERGIDEGRYDRLDMPAVVQAVTRWMRDGMWR